VVKQNQLLGLTRKSLGPPRGTIWTFC